MGWGQLCKAHVLRVRRVGKAEHARSAHLRRRRLPVSFAGLCMGYGGTYPRLGMVVKDRSAKRIHRQERSVSRGGPTHLRCSRLPVLTAGMCVGWN
jgi:hypothetical protein